MQRRQPADHNSQPGHRWLPLHPAWAAAGDQLAPAAQHRWLQGLLCCQLLSCSPGGWRVQVETGLAQAIGRLRPPSPIAARERLELLERRHPAQLLTQRLAGLIAR